MELLELSGLFLTRGGWGLMNQSCYPSDKAYRSAKSRLLKQGLIANHSEKGASPTLSLTDSGKERIPDYFYPEKRWNRSWNKVWYMLIYDVPEVDRTYRNVLRSFLRQHHMGCLQKSVWVTPDDIRPEFDDLVQAANIDAFAYLFESKTVLGLSGHRIAEDAWDYNGLQDVQEHFCSVTMKNIELLQSDSFSPPDLNDLMRSSLTAYHAAMINDPLLPEPLLPRNYAGKQVYAVHRTLLNEIDKQAGMLHPR